MWNGMRRIPAPGVESWAPPTANRISCGSSGWVPRTEICLKTVIQGSRLTLWFSYPCLVYLLWKHLSTYRSTMLMLREGISLVLMWIGLIGPTTPLQQMYTYFLACSVVGNSSRRWMRNSWKCLKWGPAVLGTIVWGSLLEVVHWPPEIEEALGRS